MSRARGHVRKRGNKWAVVIDLGTDPGTGKRRQRWHSGYTTKKAAEKARTELLRQVDGAEYVHPSRRTVAGFLVDEWLPARRDAVRASTFAGYQVNTDAYIVPTLGKVLLQELTAADLNGLYARLRASGGHGRAPLSPKTVRNVHGVLRRALGDAVRWGLLVRNPAELADPPRVTVSEMRTWTAAELRRFLDATGDDRFAALWRLAATTAMRRGELLGLSWEALDLDRGRAHVVQTLVAAPGGPVLSEPKTAKSRRSVALDGATVSALREHRRRQVAERLAWGPGWQDSGLVFGREDGSPLPPAQVTRRFQRLAADAGVPVIRLHDLRHTWATLALRANVHPKVVSERLGHASVAITLDRYSHAVPALQEEAAERVAALILGG